MKPYSLWKKIGFKSGFKFNHVTLKCQMLFFGQNLQSKVEKRKSEPLNFTYSKKPW